MAQRQQSPFIRLLLSLVLVLGTLLVFTFGIDWIIDAVADDDGWIAANAGLINVLLMNAGMVAAYWFYVVQFEQREVQEFQGPGIVREFAVGTMIGAGLLATVVLILWLGGFYQVQGVNSYMVLMVPFVTMLVGSLGEELIFRIILFRIVEEGLGSWIALLISSALFGLAHLGNPAATWTSTLAISLEAGILLGAVYMISRRVWMIWGLHFAWNFTQGPIFGIQVSGIERVGWIDATVAGPEFLTGGAFGVEASMITVILCLGVAGGLLFRAKKEDQLQRSGLFKRAKL